MTVLTVARGTALDSFRDRILYLPIVFVLFILVGSLFFGGLSLGNMERLVVDFGLGGITFFSLLTAVFLGIGWSYQGMARRTAYSLLARPIPRRSVLWGAFLGLAGIQLIMLLFMALSWRFILLLAGVAWTGILTTTLALLYVEVLLVTAIAFLLSSIASPAVAGAGSVVLLIAGYGSRGVHELAAHLPAGGMRWLSEGAYYMVPCLSNFTPGDLGLSPSGGGGSECALAVAYGLSYTVALLTLAAVAFSRRELH